MSPTLPLRRGTFGFVALIAMATPSWVFAGVGLGFEYVEYLAPAQTSVLELKVVVDSDTGIAGAQPIPNGLFSYGFIVRFDPARLQPLVHGPVTVEPALDHSGFANGALINQASGFLTVKGNIIPSGRPMLVRNSRSCVSRPLARRPPPTSVTIEVFEQRPSEAVFVDGAGSGLDPLIVPRPSTGPCLPRCASRVGPAGSVAAHARLTYRVHPAADFRLESTDSLAPGTWQPLPGAPHNSGSGLNSTAAYAASTGWWSSIAS